MVGGALTTTPGRPARRGRQSPAPARTDGRMAHPPGIDVQAGICRYLYIRPVNAFALVAEPTRRRILDLLLEGEQPVNRLADDLGTSQPTVSKHLRVLREAGLVSVRVDGQHRHYRLQPAGLEEIDEWLTPYRSLWAQRLDALGTYLDRGTANSPDERERGPRSSPVRPGRRPRAG